MSNSYDVELEYWPPIGAEQDWSASFVDVESVRLLGHELNNMLQSITNISDNISDEEKTKSFNKNVDELLFAIDFGSYAIGRIFILTDAGKKYNEKRRLSDIIEQFREYEDITVLNDLGDPKAEESLYSEGLVVALTELIANARDARPHESPIEIHFRTKMAGPSDGGLVRCLSITVRDFGCGMPEGTMATLFSGPFTTKKTGAARGLGLLIVARILGKIGGGLSVSSTSGSGTEVELTIPEGDGDEE